MGRTLTNNLSLAYAIQESFGVLGAQPAWKLLEPNGGITIGPDITTVPRDPISPNRQRRAGTITDLDSTVEFEADITLDSFLDFIEGFLFATATNDRFVSGALRQTLIADATLATLLGSGYTHSSGVTVPVGQLMFARGFTSGINNGLKEVTESNATEIEVDGGASGILDEDPGNTGFATLETAGWRFTDLVWDDTAKTLTSATVDPSTIGLTLGQLVYIGGSTASERFHERNCLGSSDRHRIRRRHGDHRRQDPQRSGHRSERKRQPAGGCCRPALRSVHPQRAGEQRRFPGALLPVRGWLAEPLRDRAADPGCRARRVRVRAGQPVQPDDLEPSRSGQVHRHVQLRGHRHRASGGWRFAQDERRQCRGCCPGRCVQHVGRLRSTRHCGH